MDPTTAVIVLAVIAETCALLGLWSRLHWRARREQQRHRYVARVATAMAPNGLVELDDRDGTGHHLRVRIVHTVSGEDRTT
ncbi:hypothetical protein [Streptomyces sp. NPDC005955]|uniref:hypothetical protein n=1 Tax=Streptomyces sp. NPDC005955 TaxID=3364738 RepID=UPI00368B8A9F